MHTTSAFTGITARKQMYVARSSSVTSSVLPVPPVIRPVLILSGNAVTALTRLLMSAMDARKPSITVRLHASTAMMPSLQTASTGNPSHHPGPA